MFVLQKIYNFLLDIVQSILLAAAVFLVIYIFLFRPYQVNGASMYPSFENKEYVLTNLVAIKFTQLKKGDVIVFKAPTDKEKEFIKRIIGLPGDSVMVKNGDVYVNNEKLDESGYLSGDVKTYAGAFLKEGIPVTVPEGNYIVFGDNRQFSSDSREWGFVPQENVTGMSMYVYWPPDKMKLVKNPFE